jgi:hypothetical protein
MRRFSTLPLISAGEMSAQHLDADHGNARDLLTIYGKCPFLA